MGLDKKLCALCAWRENCVKKFRFTDGVALHCVDYCRDITIKESDRIEDEKERDSKK